MEVQPRIKSTQSKIPKVKEEEQRTDPKEEIEEDEPKEENKKYNVSLGVIILFGVIIVVLIVVIVWLLWNKKTKVEPQARPQQPKTATLSPKTEQLANLANLPIVDTNPPQEPQEPQEIEEPQEEEPQEVEEKPFVSIETATEEENVPLTETIDSEVKKMEQEQKFEQVDLKTNTVINTFTKDELFKANYNIEKVTEVCNGKMKSHQKFGWRYAL